MQGFGLTTTNWEGGEAGGTTHRTSRTASGVTQHPLCAGIFHGMKLCSCPPYSNLGAYFIFTDVYMKNFEEVKQFAQSGMTPLGDILYYKSEL